ncbi:MAG: hypothetical protein V4619_00345 [Bacteroidota bacterium]
MGIIANIIEGKAPGSPTQYYANVYIELRDQATNQLVNGNNVVVDYIIIYNGITTSHQAIVSGQKLLLEQNALLKEWDVDGNLINLKTYVTTAVGQPPAPAPPVNNCDVAINVIKVDRAESSPGAADAQISVSAFSSYLPLQYSLDNVNFQTSNIFTGLTGGLKTVYVYDANPLGCVDTGQVEISTLTNLLIDEPSVPIGSNVSRWNAAFNPVVFTYKREDFNVLNANMNSVDGKLKIFVNTDTGKVEKGDLVYLNAGPYKNTYKVFASGPNYLIIDTQYTSTAVGFININKLRPYYRVITEISYTDVYGQDKTIQSSNRPDRTGMVKADISNFLQSLVLVKDDSDFTAANFRDNNLSACYRIKYAQQWDSPDGASTITTNWISITNPYYIVYAAKQLGQRHGGNLAEYVPFTNAQPQAKWLTDFAEPVYSNNYPFDIGFIYSDDILGLDIYLELTLLDINRNPLAGGAQTSALLNEDSSWLVNQDAGKLVISRPTTTAEPLLKQLGLNRLLVDNDFPAEAYYFTIALKYNQGSTPKQITQTQTVRIDKEADDRSVYLRWIGLTGSWNYYRFVYNQEVSLDVQNAVIIKNHVGDWEKQDGIEEVISKTAGQKIKVMAQDLSVADIKGLQSIKYSPKVQMLTGNAPAKWQTVVINTATFSEYETLNGQAPFSVTFNLPSINIQTQ